MAKTFIGTSGYSYDHWIGKFYPGDLPSLKWLEFYAEHFDTVELNVTFYRLPSEKVFKNWNKRTPKDFLFVVKGSRFITHVKKLNNCKEPLNLFFSRAKLLKEKLGIILWQLSPNLKVNVERLEKFLELLISYHLSSIPRFAFEFRHPSWFCDEIYNLLKKYNCSLVITDSPSFPKKEIITADFIYLRFHGGQELYGSNYSEKELKGWVGKVERWQKQDLDIYVYFNNDAYGHAIENAKTLKSLLK